MIEELKRSQDLPDEQEFEELRIDNSLLTEASITCLRCICTMELCTVRELHRV